MAEKKQKNAAPYKPGRACPKCGRRMGEHKDRFSCGSCGYMEVKAHDKKV